MFKSKTLDEIASGETAVTVGTPVSITHTGLDGYFEFMDGLGTGQNSAVTLSTSSG